jgi:predicted metalloprotease with PDZ domain
MEYRSDAQVGDSVLMLSMPVWTPGYYEILDFPKHLCDFSAFSTAGRPLSWKKIRKNYWSISMPADGNVSVSYRVYANQRDVGSSRVDSTIAFIAPAGVFMYVANDVEHPVSVTFNMPEEWEKIASGLKADSGNPHRFSAPDFDTLYDSPFLLGNYYTRSFRHDGHDYDFAIETPDGIEELDFEGCFKKIVSATTELMGDVPYDNYCLIHMGKGGGGLEHFNSQACYTDGTYRFSRRFDRNRFLAFTTHEYFHLYNVKCIRPAELWPFDYDRENFTPMLWVSEGLTCYYEFQILLRSGLVSTDEALDILTNYFCRYAPYEGQRHMSLRQSSYDIWLNFMNEDANERDVRINYYFKGPIVGLLMDIEIRRLTNNRRSLDDVMRGLYNRYYKELKRGFTEEEFWSLAAEVAGNQLTEIRRIVDTTVDIDYDRYLSLVGLKIDDTWRIVRMDNPSKEQKLFMEAMNMR